MYKRVYVCYNVYIVKRCKHLQSADTKGEINMAKTNVATKTTVAKKVAPKTVAPKTEKKVAEKKADPKPKTDYKAVAESLEAAFKSDKTVDVIADSKLENPKSVTYTDFTYIHFYKKGTEKDLFGCYLIGKNRTRFALNLAVENQLEGLDVTPVEKKIKGEKKKVAVDVICKNEDAVVVAKKIISAYQNIPAKEKPAKAEKPTKATEKKSTEKVVNK